MLNIFLIIGDTILGLVVLALLVNADMSEKLNQVFKFGIWVGAIGLLGQAYLSYIFITQGAEVACSAPQIWFLKDISLWMILAVFIYAAVKNTKLIKGDRYDLD